MAKRILIVEDDATVRALLKRTLEKEHYEVLELAEGGEAPSRVLQDRPDAVILDFNLPGLSGAEICVRLRGEPVTRGVPVLMLTGVKAEGFSVKCLDGGADDYLEKPFDIPELLARVRALLRRPNIYANDKPEVKVGKMLINAETHLASYDGQRIQGLTPKEFEVLRQILLVWPNMIDKKTLALKVWGKALEDINERTVDVHVRRIRDKAGEPVARLLKTIPALGYQWDSKAHPPS